MSDQFHRITTVTVRLSAAVKLIDTFTGETPISVPEFFLNGKQASAYGHAASGYWSLADLAAGRYQLQVDADYYFPATVDFDLDESGVRLAVDLEPQPYYPYPDGTMIRGQVTEDIESASVPLADVEVVATYSQLDPTTQTARAAQTSGLTDNQGRYDGRYALFFNNLNPDHTEVLLTFQKTGYETAVAAVTAQNMTTIFHNQVMTPNI